MTPELLKRMIADQADQRQYAYLENPALGYVKRTYEKKLALLAKNKEIIVLKGVRRSGKSVLLQQVRQQNAEKDYFTH